MHEEGTTTERLMRAFKLFNKAEWHRRSIEGHKPSELHVMMVLIRSMKREKQGLMVSEISNMLHVTSPTITQLIKGMESQGLVTRNVDPEDRRVIRIALTDKGIAVTKKAKAVMTEYFNGLIEYLGEEDSEKLAELLTKVHTYFDENPPIPWREIEKRTSGDDHE
jgi:DNA-binding MarR family transcriptional regulator